MPQVSASGAGEPLKVDPAKLRATADQIDEHAAEFRSAHENAHAQASSVNLGSGLAAAALPGMLAAWQANGARLDRLSAEASAAHRDAAALYEGTDSDNAEDVGDAGSRM